MGATTTRPKAWFGSIKKVLTLFIKRPQFVYEGAPLTEGAILLSNHAGALGPLTYELYLDQPFRFWGTYEMNGSFPEVYAYLTKIYYHRKKHWNLTLARIFCCLAAPLCYLFYRGLNLISTYPDVRLKTTIRESIRVLQQKQSLVIFPEDSSHGYFDELTMFHRGFLLLAERCVKQGIDAPLYVAYYRKRDKRCFIDRPILLSELLASGSMEEIAVRLCNRCNQLGRTEA